MAPSALPLPLHKRDLLACPAVLPEAPTGFDLIALVVEAVVPTYEAIFAVAGSLAYLALLDPHFLEVDRAGILIQERIRTMFQPELVKVDNGRFPRHTVVMVANADAVILVVQEEPGLLGYTFSL